MNPLLRRLLFLSGQLGMMGLARFFFQWMIKFSESGGGSPAAAGSTASTASALFPAAAVGAVLFGFRIFDGVTDPLAGVISDAWVRTGRPRRSLLWYSFFVPALGLALCFAPNPTMDPAVRWTLLVSGMFVFFVGYTFYAIPYWSLLDDLAGEDGDERRVLSNLLGAGLLLATLLGFVVSPFLVERYGYLPAALGFAVPAAALMLLPAFLPAVAPAHPTDEPAPSVWTSLTRAFGHRRFVAVLLLFAGSQMSFTVMTAAAPFIAEDLLGGTVSDVARLLGPFLGTAIPCFLVAPAISHRLGWERSITVASILLGVVYAATAGLGQAIVGSAMTTATVLFALGGPMAAVLLGLEGEAIAACARERDPRAISIYFGVFNLVVKALNGLALLITGILVGLAKDPAIGTTAIRGMGLTAGGLLFLGGTLYALIRPRPPRG